MKKVIIPLATVFLLGIGFLAFLLYWKYDREHFGTDLIPYTDFRNPTKITVSIDKGPVTEVSYYLGYDLYVLLNRGYGDRQKHFFNPYDKEELGKSYEFTFGENLHYSVYEAPDVNVTKLSKKDCVLIVVNDGSSYNKYYTVVGYATMKHLDEIMAPDFLENQYGIKE